MDELIKEYAEKLHSARLGDYTYEGLLAEFAREVIVKYNTPFVREVIVKYNTPDD